MSVIPVRHYDIDKEFHKMLGINKRDKLLVKLKNMSALLKNRGQTTFDRW